MKKIILVLLIAVFAVMSCNKEKTAEVKNTETSENKENIQPIQEEKNMTIYDFTVKDRKGNDVPMATFKGKVLLIVNYRLWFYSAV